MAVYKNVTYVSVPRAASLVGDTGEVVTIDTDGRAALVTNTTDIPAGVVAEAPEAATSGLGQTTPAVGRNVTIATLKNGSIIPMKAGAAITAGQLIVLDATDGRVAGAANVGAVTDDSAVLGFALEAAADGELLKVLVQFFVA